MLITKFRKAEVARRSLMSFQPAMVCGTAL